ncbi:hypothetical protein ACLOJK_004596 [Asimina triloba]
MGGPGGHTSASVLHQFCGQLVNFRGRWCVMGSEWVLPRFAVRRLLIWGYRSLAIIWTDLGFSGKNSHGRLSHLPELLDLHFGSLATRLLLDEALLLDVSRRGLGGSEIGRLKDDGRSASGGPPILVLGVRSLESSCPGRMMGEDA